MKPACLSIFKDLIKEKRAEVLYVKIAKNRTIDERNRMAARAKKRLAAARAAHPNLTDEEIRIELIKRAMTRMRDIGKSGELWMFNPLPSLAEPEKAISYLTDKGHLALDDKAKLYDRASLHSIDTFFMTVRRRLSPLERPISPSRRGRRTWNGYSPYNPAIVQKLLDIVRVWYNYCPKSGVNRPTPAMKLGLAKGPVQVEDILYYDPSAPYRRRG